MATLETLKYNIPFECIVDNYSLEDIMSITEYDRTLAYKCRNYRNSRKIAELPIQNRTSHLNTIHYPTLDDISLSPNHNI